MARLRLNIDDTQTTLPVDDTTSLPVNGGVILIGSEQISYTYASDTEVLGCTRGFNSTPADSHLAGDAIELQTVNVPTYQPTELRDSGSPEDNLTGVGFAETGARYTNEDNGDLYLNTGTASEPTWSLLSTSDVGAVWGNITGDITDQTDLQAALNSKLETVTASDVDSEAATMGQVLTADGNGAATWEDAGSGLPAGLTFDGQILTIDDANPTLTGPALSVIHIGDANIDYVDFPAVNGITLGPNQELNMFVDSGDIKIQSTGTANLKLESVAGEISMPSNNYTFTFNPGTGGVSGIQSITGPADDDLVVNSTSGFDLNLSVDNAADFINFKLGGNTDFWMGNNELNVTNSIVFHDSGLPHTFIASQEHSGIEVMALGGYSTPAKILIGTNVPGALGASFEIQGTHGGFLPPRMTETQRDALTAVAGLMVYNTDTNKLNVYTTTWETITSL